MPFSALRRRFVNPFLEFLSDSRSIGVVLLCCTALSLLLSNTISEPYLAFWTHSAHFLQALHLPHSLLHWINDGMMTVFFFLVGMEIKREMKGGELASIKKALLPIAGAIGGMIVPALIFGVLTAGTVFSRGFGIPMATDIAFSLGIASLLGKKVPMGLKIFLTALAIIDDLGAIVVIALFYGSAINFIWVALCLVVFAILILVIKHIRHFSWVHIVLALALWYCMFNSGIHATVAGVMLAAIIPVNRLNYLENKLHHPVYFFIMPLFALANTAIIFPAGGPGILNSALPWAVIAGLVLGKPLGIVLATWLMVKTKLAYLPSGTNWYKMTGAGLLAGIGFTMSIFIATLAFADKPTQDLAKIAVLVASFVAMAVGFAWLYFGKLPSNNR